MAAISEGSRIDHSREGFIDNIPPESWVWSSRSKHLFGQTVPGRIYDHPDLYVGVKNISGITDKTGVWLASNVELLSAAELKKVEIMRSLSR